MTHFLQTCSHIHYQVKLAGQRFYTTVGMNCICVCWDIQQFIMLICILLLSLVDLFLTEQGILTSSQTILLFQKTSIPTSILGKAFFVLPTPTLLPKFPPEISSLSSNSPLKLLDFEIPQGIFNNPPPLWVSIHRYFLELYIGEDDDCQQGFKLSF